MIRHVFMYKVADGADPETIVRILHEIPDRVPGIRFWQFGKHSGEAGSSGELWDFVLISDFDSWKELQDYSDHPFHQKVVEKLLPMFAARAVCDFEYDPPEDAQ